MSEEIAATAAAAATAPADKRAQVERLLTDILNLMESPASLSFKDADDGSLAVAVKFAGEPPQGVVTGKRNYLVDSLQFLINKCINRPNLPKRWVSLGVGDFPEPRAPKPAGAPQASAPIPAAAPAITAPPANGAAKRPSESPKPAPKPPPRASEPEEAQLKVDADPALTRLGKALAEKSSSLGRTYAVLTMSADDRSRLLGAAQGTAGVTVRAEGEGIHRRVAFIPAKPVAMPKKSQMPDYPDDED